MQVTWSVARPLLLSWLITCFPLAGWARAQVRVTTLDELRQALSPGDTLSVVETTGGTVKGQLLQVGPDDLRIRTVPFAAADRRRPPLEITIPLGTIQSLERPRDPSRNGTLIGAGIGAGTSLAMFIHAAAVDYNEIDEWAPAYLVGAGVLTAIGALAGWAIDRAHSKPRLMFVAPSARSTTAHAITRPGRGAGIVLVVSY